MILKTFSQVVEREKWDLLSSKLPFKHQLDIIPSLVEIQTVTGLKNREGNVTNRG